MSRVGVTGASGYVGRRLLRQLRALGHVVVVLGRQPVAGVRAHRHADLREPVPDGLLEGLDVVVHLAAETGAGAVTREQEIAFASALVTQATRLGCRIVFVSSQAAAVDAPSAYGRTKAAIEAIVLAAGGRVARPGQVVGGSRAGLFGGLEHMVRRLPVLPALVWPRPRVWPIHVDDLADALARLVDAPAAVPATLSLGGPPVTFSALHRAIAEHSVRRRVVFVPVPVALLRGALALASRWAGPRLAPTRLDSLVRLPLPVNDGLAALGIVPRALAAGLREGASARRARTREGARLARALLGRRAPPSLWRRYARALPALGVADALDLPHWLGPSLLASLDARARRGAAMTPGDLAWRFGVVARLAEAEPRLAARFLATEPGRVRAAASLVAAALLELRSRVLAPLGNLGRPRP